MKQKIFVLTSSKIIVGQETSVDIVKSTAYRKIDKRKEELIMDFCDDPNVLNPVITDDIRTNNMLDHDEYYRQSDDYGNELILTIHELKEIEEL